MFRGIGVTTHIHWRTRLDSVQTETALLSMAGLEISLFGLRHTHSELIVQNEELTRSRSPCGIRADFYHFRT